MNYDGIIDGIVYWHKYDSASMNFNMIKYGPL